MASGQTEQSDPTGGRDRPTRRVDDIGCAIAENATAVRRYLFGMCGDWDRAEDLAQEALLKAWSKRKSFSGKSTVRTWVFTIARNHWRDRLRRAKVRPESHPLPERERFADDGPSPDRTAQRRELAEAVADAMDRLPDEQREALALREAEVTFREIGEMLDIPSATVKSRVRYALAKLVEELRAFAPERRPGRSVKT